jgi:transposase
VDWVEPGTKHHALTDGVGIPLAASVTGANAHDVTQLLPLVDSIPPLAGKRGAPRWRTDAVPGDRAFDSEPHRRASHDRGIEPLPARKVDTHGSGLGTYRRVVARTLGWSHQYRRLRTRYERRADIHQASLTLACIKICFSFLQATYCQTLLGFGWQRKLLANSRRQPIGRGQGVLRTMGDRGYAPRTIQTNSPTGSPAIGIRSHVT